MHTRALLTAIAGGLIAAGGAFAACSSSSSVGVTDAGHDATMVTVFETGLPDIGLPPKPETSTPETGPSDAGADRRVSDAAVEAHAIDASFQRCSLITGPCDIVAQNCSAGSECVIAQAADGGLTTECIATGPTEKLAKGAECCPASDGVNPCAPGLTCTGGNACASDGGWGGSNCTPYCCPSDAGPSTANCGIAEGGVQGFCNLSFSVTNNGPPAYSVCTYPTGCTPLRGPECLSGFGCEIGAEGGAGCTLIYNPNGDGGAGATNGQSCTYSNSCADGYVCLGLDASTCQWMCHVANAAPPFDAALLENTPGYGGCPTGQSCEGIIGFPSWLGACVTQ